ncbi:dihydrofolate reductase [Frisingicoccus sp.]|uniref:dihydrofolate reductase n=1 Tax=Frisingicoccus sp. TaxID=1918627 RepID=UPI003AB64D97
MNIIVAVDKNWAIGYQNKLLNSIPEDMKFFRETTTGKVVVMGRKTLESFPNGRPLKNRTNVVITRQKGYEVPGAVVVHSVDEAMDYLKNFKSEDIYVIGGASIYEQMLPYCDVAHVTVMDYAYQADTWFPDLDAMEDFVVAADSEEKTYFDLEYCFKMYVRKSKLKEIIDFMD